MKIATFNIENLDNIADEKNPTLAERKPTLVANLNRIDANILCLQEVHGQEAEQHTSDNPDRTLSALDTILEGTKYQSFHRAVTLTSSNMPYNERNLVILSEYPIQAVNQYKNDYIDKLEYKKVTASPKHEKAQDVPWERPILHVRIAIEPSTIIHVINLHMKSRLASNIPGFTALFLWCIYL